jgi:hypothetical protein
MRQIESFRRVKNAASAETAQFLLGHGQYTTPGKNKATPQRRSRAAPDEFPSPVRAVKTVA